MPRADELAAALNVSEADILEAMETGAASVVSLDAVPEGEEDAAPMDAFLGTEDAGFADFEREDAVRAGYGQAGRSPAFDYPNALF